MHSPAQMLAALPWRREPPAFPLRGPPGLPSASPAAPGLRLGAEAGWAHQAGAFASGGPPGAGTREDGNAEVEILGSGVRNPEKFVESEGSCLGLSNRGRATKERRNGP